MQVAKIKTTQKFWINSTNQLVINQNVTLNGTWSLTDNYELCLTFDGTQDTGFGNKLILKGTLQNALPHSLSFEVRNDHNPENIITETVALSGVWQADEHNKLLFKVKKESGRHDILTFNNTWIINQKNRLIYEYEKADLVFKKKETYCLVFKGYWDLSIYNRLYYELDQSSDSKFEFKIGASTLERNYIKTKVMIGTHENELTLNGELKISSELGLTFEVNYGNNEIKPISLGGELQLSTKDKLSVKLGNALDLKLIHELIKDKADFSIAYHQDNNAFRAQFGIGVKF